MVSTFLAVYLFTELALSEQWIGFIVTAYGSGAVLGALGGGLLCSHVHPVRLILAALVFLGFSFFCLSIVEDAIQFTVLIFIGAIFEGMFRPPVMLLLMDSVPADDRTRCYALFQTSLNLGYAIGAVLGGFLAEIHFSLIFWVDGGTSLFAALLLFCLMSGRASSVLDGGPRDDPRGQGKGINWPLAVLFLVALLNYCVVNQRLSIYPLYLSTDYGLYPSEFGALLMFNGLLIAAFGVLVTDWLKKVDQRFVASFGSLLLCGSFALLPLGNSLAFAVFTCVVMTIGEIFFMPSIVTLVYNWSRQGAGGRSMGFLFAVTSTCRAVGPIAGVWSFGALGSALTWAICGGLGLATAALLLGLLQRAPERTQSRD